MFKFRFRGLEVLVNEQVNTPLAHEIEKRAFVDEPAETVEGLDFLKTHGKLLLVENIGIAESIELDELLRLGLDALPPESPLRMIVENNRKNGVLENVKEEYQGRPRYHYLHAIAVDVKGQGYGSWLFGERTKRILGRNEIGFGFVMPDNLPAIRMYLRHGALLDKVEEEVYVKGQPYVRMVHDESFSVPFVRRATLSRKDKRVVEIGAKRYLSDVRVYLNAGYVGTKFEQPNRLVFQRRL
ncbi:hypothetical protein HYY70_00970 [Candidatus Woesearchaeota archaeon]|nr:hypothetical protein [Candidatus Woesearchaeota archaeon]